MTNDWSLIMDDWWLITEDWWLMIDDWWLMSDEWWLMIDDKINTNIIWNVKYRLPQGGAPPGASKIWGPFHNYICSYFIIIHQSSLITHQSSVINHQSSVLSYQPSIIHDQWSIISHQLPVIFFSTSKKRTSSKHKKERAQRVIPGGTRKKDSSAKSLNDTEKSKRKSAKSYPRRHEKKRIAPQSLQMISKSQKERKDASHWSFDHWSLVLNGYDKWLT